MKKIFATLLLAFVATAAAATTAAAQARPGTINVEQSPAVAELLRKHIAYNTRNPKISGWRIRIYSDNSSGSRSRSEGIAAGFAARFPDIATYREYDNPYFKVSVGDFRNRDEAMRTLEQFRQTYPLAVIVPASINLPPL